MLGEKRVHQKEGQRVHIDHGAMDAGNDGISKGIQCVMVTDWDEAKGIIAKVASLSG